jgi:hypothetical protein
VLAAGAAGGAVAWWLHPGRGNPPVSPSASLAAAAPAVPESTPAPKTAELSRLAMPGQAVGVPVAALETPAARAAAPAPARAPEHAAPAAILPPGSPAPARPTRPPAVAERRPPSAAGFQEQAAPPPGEVRQAASAAAETRERTFGLDADLGYAKLHLDYIVYRSKAPFAGINGRQVTIGTIIEGFTVEEIGPDDVRLRDANGLVVLRVP